MAVQEVRLMTLLGVLSATLSYSPTRCCCNLLQELTTVQTFLVGCHTIADEDNKRKREVFIIM
jgi:hypothetical protein